MVERGADEHLKRYDYCIQIAKYLVVETFVCICFSALFQNLGPPPWCLKAGSWHETITRVSLWLNMCHGAATFANGDFTKDFQTPRLKILWLACLFLTCVGQGFAMTIPSTPPLVRLVVAGVANVALITVHVWPTIPDGRESIQNAVRYHVEDRVLWISHAILLLETTGRASDGTSLTGSLSIIVLAQALWQFVAWLDGLQSAPYCRYALVTTTAQLSHIISIYMTWRAQVLGLGHASIVVYLFFALSSALYEPRASLPNFAADKSMSVWCASAAAGVRERASTCTGIEHRTSTLVTCSDAAGASSSTPP